MFYTSDIIQLIKNDADKGVANAQFELGQIYFFWSSRFAYRSRY